MAEFWTLDHETAMNLEDHPKPEKLPATSFRVEGDTLVCSGPTIPDKRIPFSQIRAWVDVAQGRVQTFSLMLREGASLDIEDPDGILEAIMSEKMPGGFYSC
jgi:hypothetical protein